MIILPTPTQMFEGIQFQSAFGDTTITSCALAEQPPQMQCSSVAGDPFAEDHDTCHDLPPAGSPQARRRTCYLAYPMGYHCGIF